MGSVSLGSLFCSCWVSNLCAKEFFVHDVYVHVFFLYYRDLSHGCKSVYFCERFVLMYNIVYWSYFLDHNIVYLYGIS